MEQALIEDITVIRKNGVLSEQTFRVRIISSFDTGEHSATLQENIDYAFDDAGNNSLSLLFQPNVTGISVPFTLFPDELFEGTENFRLSIESHMTEFPSFQLPIMSSNMSMAFAETQVRILDNESKFLRMFKPFDLFLSPK